MSTPFRRYLQQELQRRQKQNARYSIRAFARDLEVDATALSRLLAGKRAVGTQTARRILDHLKLAPSTRESLLRSLLSPQDHAVPVDEEYVAITPDQMERMDDWAHSATLELARSQGARLDIPALAAYFGLPIARVEGIVRTLTELGLVRRTERGLGKVHDRTTAIFKERSAALDRVILGYIDRAKHSLAAHPAEDHDFSGITVLASREKLPEATRRIKEFRRSLAHFLAAEDGDTLFRLNIQLFSLRALPADAKAPPAPKGSKRPEPERVARKRKE